MRIKRRDLIRGIGGLSTTAIIGCRGASPTAPGTEMEGERVLVDGPHAVNFAATTIIEHDACVAVLDDLARGDTVSDSTLARLERARLTLARWELTHGPIWVVSEARGSQRGSGVYAFRRPMGDRRRLVLQAPHAYFDTDTGRIAARAFLGARGPDFAALFLNTVHRYRPVAGGPKRDPSPSDLAHVNEHLFNRLTLAYANRHAPLDVIQLHGFANRRVRRRDDSRAPGKPRAVVSAGAPESTAHSRAITTALKAHFGVGVWGYPEKAGDLGGIDNAQARTLMAVPGVRFVHIEMAARMRRALIEDGAELEHLIDALTRAREVGE